MTQELTGALNEAFQLYIGELRGARTLQTYLGTLHLVCAVPDVCGALESDDGKASAARYVRWADRHLVKGDAVMTGADWYKMRCVVLHQGSSLPTDPRGQPSQYASISFVTPGNAEGSAHRVVIRLTEGNNITLDIAQLADEMLVGLADWFDWLHDERNGTERGHVLSRLRTVISPRPKVWPELPNSGITWSSSGATPVIVVDFE